MQKRAKIVDTFLILNTLFTHTKKSTEIAPSKILNACARTRQTGPREHARERRDDAVRGDGDGDDDDGDVRVGGRAGDADDVETRRWTRTKRSRARGFAAFKTTERGRWTTRTKTRTTTRGRRGWDARGGGLFSVGGGTRGGGGDGG